MIDHIWIFVLRQQNNHFTCFLQRRSTWRPENKYTCLIEGVCWDLLVVKVSFVYSSRFYLILGMNFIMFLNVSLYNQNVIYSYQIFQLAVYQLIPLTNYLTVIKLCKFISRIMKQSIPQYPDKYVILYSIVVIILLMYYV